MEKDPEIAVITALLGVLASYEWKKLSDRAQLRVLEVFHARRCEDQASKGQKPAPSEQATYRKYEDLLDNSELKRLADMPLGPGKDDYGRKPRPPFDTTCAIVASTSASFSNNPLPVVDVGYDSIGLPPGVVIGLALPGDENLVED